MVNPDFIESLDAVGPFDKFTTGLSNHRPHTEVLRQAQEERGGYTNSPKGPDGRIRRTDVALSIRPQCSWRRGRS